MTINPVLRHFDEVAQRFDDIYSAEKGWPQRIVDCLFRQVVHRRFRLALELCGGVGGKRILDIGCGSGRYSVEMARRGADVLGIDFSTKMLDLARRAAAAAEVAERCKFINEDFLTWREPHHFEICLGLGTASLLLEPDQLHP